MRDAIVSFFKAHEVPKNAADYVGAAMYVVLTLAALVVVDVLLRIILGLKKSDKAHWFALHSIGNFFVVITSLPDMYLSTADPAASFDPARCGAHALACNDIATAIIAGIHLYHVVAYSNLDKDDYFHHGLFCGTILPLHFVYPWGTVSNCLCFFISGLPGGIDYALLAAVKCGRMASITEKKINTFLNMWVRGPGLLAVTCLVWVSFLYQPVPQVPLWAILVGMLIVMFNGQYYAERVVASLYTHVERQRFKPKSSFRSAADLFTSAALKSVD